LYGFIVKPAFDSLMPSSKMTTPGGGRPVFTMPDGRKGGDVTVPAVPLAVSAVTRALYN
jgi:hypothetical protein